MTQETLTELKKNMQWYELTAKLRSEGYTSIGWNIEKMPHSDDWQSVHYGKSCITIRVSENLKMYTTIDSGD